MVEAEIVEPGQDFEARSSVRLTDLRALGLFGTVMALLTMVAAFGFGFLVLFGTTLASAAVVALFWPLVFSPQFTEWVFGSPKAPFWKLFLICLALGIVLRLFRRQLWQRK